ncbi:MAG: RHS repeat-associated core domain-containing protein [Desulfobacteraceae bacterium]|nr:RHS repeat-associated core domain-containing protein [Desulfobacteraceae bacterium]
MLQEITGRNNRNITAYYLANGQLVARQEYNVRKVKSHSRYRHRPRGRLEYYAHDGLGSIVALTDHRGKLRNQVRYDVYGGLVVGDLNETPYGFTGKRFDVESGLYHFHFRKYDPVTGVWTTEDPIRVAGGINLYGYVRNDPVNWIDFFGLDPFSGVKDVMRVSPTFKGDVEAIERIANEVVDKIPEIIKKGLELAYDIGSLFFPGPKTINLQPQPIFEKVLNQEKQSAKSEKVSEDDEYST